jgi:hypothetical protein
MKVYVTCDHGVDLDKRCPKCEAERDKLVEKIELEERVKEAGH